ncbi:hypothetical protein ONZ51_g11479 [Trametes cubensis]|uniref:Zona occludens toxin N-terminal domain-containing protein n=1 Tax=Trametes cubensis TaxID=1111947 RepID=A0AAD7TJ66_9APHY|nr:hypothetical protein ONZ51_g11479 [Trametes cubensis]
MPSPPSDSDSSDRALDELALLCDDCTVDDAIEDHELMTAPLFTREAYLTGGISETRNQYGVLGSVLSVHQSTGTRIPDDPRLYVNTNTPFSALVCGVQGSGKSHTVSVLLESMMIADCPAIGLCTKPLSGLVLHFSEGGQGSLPCEAAWLAQTDSDDVDPPSVRVYVSKSSLSTMKKVYASLGEDVTVRPLTFSHSELDAQAILSMMAVGSSESAPLYMQSILSILRELGEKFTYTSFLAEIKEAKKDMNPHQKAALEQRLSLLASFVDPLKSRKGSLFKPGRLTIIDLSDPFIDPSSACSLFEIVTRLFVRADVGTGKVLVVDEAHKYLSATRGDTGLTKALTSLIRQQRHLSMRVVISTQEPTAVPPVLIDLCSIAIFHRFSSPAWWDSVAKRVCADVSNEQGFTQVVKLKTGQALVLCPSGLGLFPTTRKTASGAVVQGKPKVAHFGRRYLIIKTRKRITVDGGESRMTLDG